MQNKGRLWFWGIVGSLGLYMIGILIFVFYSFTQNNDLVRPDYYEADLAYDSRKAKIALVEQKNAAPQVTLMKSSVDILFPQFGTGTHFGKVTFYRAQLASMDMIVNINLSEEGRMRIPNEKLASGKWLLRFDWNDSQDDLYYETEIWIN